MSKIEELKKAFEASALGDWVSTGVVVASPTEGGMDYLLQGYHADGIKNDVNVEFAALAHNLMPELLEAFGRAEQLEQALLIVSKHSDYTQNIVNDALYEVGYYTEDEGD